MQEIRTSRLARVCPEVPGGLADHVRSIGGLLPILTLPIASTGADEDQRARPGLSRNGETKIRGSGVPIPSACLGAGQSPERLRAAACCRQDDNLISKGRGGADKSHQADL